MLKKQARKWVFPVLLAVALLAATPQLAFADTFTENSADFGGHGVVMPAGLDRDALGVDELSPSSIEDVPTGVKLNGPVMDISYTVGSETLRFPASLTYVYFNLNVEERNAWDAGLAGIYYLDLASGNWVRCGSTTLSIAGTHGRIACIAPQLTMFAIGIKKAPLAQQEGAQVSAGVQNAFFTETIAQIGNQGVWIPSGFNTGLVNIQVVRASTDLAAEMDFKLRRSLVSIEWVGDELGTTVVDEQGNEVTSTFSQPSQPLQTSYVFYIIDSEERAAWEDGRLSIYYLDTASNSWQTCSTAFAGGVGAAGAGRVYCVAPQFTLYALGIEKAVSSEE